MRAASTAALRAPLIATHATGTPGRHLHRRQQRVEPVADRVLRLDRDADHRQVGVRGDHARQRRRHAGAGDDHAQAAHVRVARVVGDRLRVAVGREHAHLEADAALLQLLAGRLHRRLVARRAHDDPDARSVDLDLLEGLLDLGHRLERLGLDLRSSPCRARARASPSRLLSVASDATRSATRCRDVAPVLRAVEARSARPLRMRARAPPRASAPRPVTFSTRPPAVTISPSLRARCRRA